MIATSFKPGFASGCDHFNDFNFIFTLFVSIDNEGSHLACTKNLSRKIFEKFEVISVGVNVEDNSTLSWAF